MLKKATELKFLRQVSLVRKGVFSMKTMKYIILGIVGIILLLPFTVLADSSDYISSDDPIVTLSYVNDVLIPKIMKQVETAIKESKEEDNETVDDDVKQSIFYEVLYLTKGQSIVAVNACELILRTGSASVISHIDSNGVADLNTGIELLNGDSLIKNHESLIPRGDGRGVVVTSEDAYIMVKGEYRIVTE